MNNIIYMGDLWVRVNDHIKPKGKRKVLLPDEKEFAIVKKVVWAGLDPAVLNERKHTKNMVCKILKIKNRDAVRILEIVNCKTVGVSSAY